MTPKRPNGTAVPTAVPRTATAASRAAAVVAAPRPRTPTLPGHRVICRRCGKMAAQIIGGSETQSVVYMRCDACHLASVGFG